MQQYVQGAVATITFTTANAAGTLIDPPVVKASVQAPDEATWFRYTYLTDPQLVKNSTGNYTVSFPTSQVGIWNGTVFSQNVDLTDNGAANVQYQVIPSFR